MTRACPAEQHSATALLIARDPTVVIPQQPTTARGAGRIMAHGSEQT